MALSKVKFNNHQIRPHWQKGSLKKTELFNVAIFDHATNWAVDKPKNFASPETSCFPFFPRCWINLCGRVLLKEGFGAPEK